MSGDQQWMPAPTTLSLEHNSVHVWRASLDLPAADVDNFQRVLSPGEQQRAAQFRFPHLRQRFIAAHGILRALLGRYLGVAAQEIEFNHSLHGKPFLSLAGATAPLQFNLSHAGGMALYAVAQTRSVGIDIEQRREIADMEGIANRFFSPPERCALSRLPAAERPLAFFRCWTRKEAYIKALGIGLSFPLDQFSVSLAPGEPAALLSTQHDPFAAERWAICELNPHPQYVAALAAEGRDWHVSRWVWPA